MGSDWKQMKLGDITTWSSGGTPKKNEPTFWGGDIPWISASSMNGHLYSDSKLRVTEAGLKNGSRIAPKGTILLLVRGSILHQKMQVGMAARDVAFNQDVKCLIPKTEKVDAWFLLLWFKSKETELLQLVENTGIGAGKFDTKLIQNYIVDIPPPSAMEKITKFGKALFDKEEANQQANQTLEKMAQALFKSWFVDFDPVIDNALAAGSDIPDALKHRVEIRRRAYALQRQNPTIQPLPAATQRLFPSEFEYCCDDSLGIQGWIPKGWKISELGDFIRFANGKAIKSSDDGIYPIYGANGIIGKTTEGRIKNAVVIGRVGAYCGAIKYCRGYFWSSDNTVVATSKISERHIPHILYLLKHLDLNQYAGGAAQPLLNQTTLKKLKVPHAETDCLNQYNTFIDSLLLKQIKNTEEIEKLSSIRDTLLPKLISGEIILNKDVE